MLPANRGKNHFAGFHIFSVTLKICITVLWNTLNYLANFLVFCIFSEISFNWLMRSRFLTIILTYSRRLVLQLEMCVRLVRPRSLIICRGDVTTEKTRWKHIWMINLIWNIFVRLSLYYTGKDDKWYNGAVLYIYG